MLSRTEITAMNTRVANFCLMEEHCKKSALELRFLVFVVGKRGEGESDESDKLMMSSGRLCRDTRIPSNKKRMIS